MARFLPILLAAFASFVFGAAYYAALGKQWMAAADKSEADMLDETGKPKPPVVPMVVSFVCEVIMAGIFAIVLARLGATAVNGVTFGFLFWVGFIATSMATNHAYQGCKIQLTVIDAGHWLGVLLIQGLVLGLIIT